MKFNEGDNSWDGDAEKAEKVRPLSWFAADNVADDGRDRRVTAEAGRACAVAFRLLLPIPKLLVLLYPWLIVVFLVLTEVALLGRATLLFPLPSAAGEE